MKLFGNWRKEPEAKEQMPFAAADAPVAVNEQPLTSAPNIGQTRKILVVDDNTVVLKAFELKLKALGFQVLTAAEGAAAVSCARQERPDVIVLDVNFPPEVGSSGLQWNGFNIMEWMRRFREVAEIPVIIISSEDASKCRQRALNAGAVDFFQKPINHEQFLLAVRRALSLRNSDKQTAA